MQINILNMQVNNYIFFSMSGFIFLILLMIVFFSKKRYSLFENNIYKYLILLTFAGIINELLMVYCIKFIKDSAILMFGITKSFLLITEAWLLFLTLYTSAVINNSNGKERKYINLEISFLIAVYFFCAITTIMLPIDYAFNPAGDSLLYTYGSSTRMVFVSSIIYISIILIYVMRNRKYTRSKKFIPVYAYIVMGISISIIQQVEPGALLISLVESLIVLMMYFTIENPDMKVLDEVHKAKEISDSANEEKAIFLYNATNIIRGISKNIEHDADAILSETDNKVINTENINDSARDIKANTAKFNTLTNEILDISSVDSASIKIYNDKYNIKLIIKQLVQIYKAKAVEKGIDFRTNIASDLPEYLYGDAVNFKTSLSTILDNSIKYTQKGYVEFNVNDIIKNDVSRLIISIEDSGIGMKADELNRIFNRRDDEEDGTNLKDNLYNAKKLITLMGGTIIPSSIYGRGTNIKIVLDQKIADEKSEYNKYEKLLDKKRILLVDDNDSSIKVISKLLKDANVILDCVTSGKECLDRIRSKEKYDLIFIDETMRPLDGKTIMKKLKETRNFNTNVILLTRNNDYEYNNEHLMYGFKDYLLKPIEKEKIIKIIGKYSK